MPVTRDQSSAITAPGEGEGRLARFVRREVQVIKPSTCSHLHTLTAPCGVKRFAITNSAPSIHLHVLNITALVRCTGIDRVFTPQPAKCNPAPDPASRF